MSTWRDPEIAEVRALLASRRPPPGAPEPTLAERRAALDTTGEAAPLPPGCRSEPLTAAGVAAERVVPAQARPERELLFLHGGGYAVGSARSHRPLVARLAAAAEARALAVGYRLAPEHPCPAAVDDTVAAYRWMLEGGADPAQTIIAGTSAGGGLAVAAALQFKALGLPQPAGLFVVSPWVDLTLAHPSHDSKATDDPMIRRAHLEGMAAAYLGGMDVRDPRASPAFGDLAGLAPMLIQVGSEEVLLGDSLLLAERAGHARVAVRLEIWPEMVHVWHGFAQLSAAHRAVAAAGQWMAERYGD
jgi:acetyl esterase/lipase